MKKSPRESSSRSLTKSVSYRVLSITADSIVAYFFTRSIVETAGIVVFVNTYSTILYYFHERVWAHVHWDKRSKVPTN
jgi:uncharacterized membrane protein